MPSKKPLVFVIAGPPASGKGTQCDLLQKRYGVVHISTGDLLRSKRETMPVLKDYMDHGKLVPDSLVVQILDKRLHQKDVQEHGVVLDGFPRTLAQAKILQQKIQIDYFVDLEVPDKVVIGRISGRRIDPLTKKVYHLKYKPPTDPEVKARVVTRPDDTPEKIIVRLRNFHKHMDHLRDFYKDHFLPIPCGDLKPALVFDLIKQAVDGKISKL